MLELMVGRQAVTGEGLDDAVLPWLRVAADFIRRQQADGSFHADIDPEATVVQVGTLLLNTLALLHLHAGEWPTDVSRHDWRRRRLREAIGWSGPPWWPPRGPRPTATGQSMAFDPPSRPPAVWSYTLDGGWVAWAGRTARDNGYLSLKVARNDDWWFHVKGMPGSHVVLFVRDGVEPPRDVVGGLPRWPRGTRSSGPAGPSRSTPPARFVSKPRGASRAS